MTRQQPIRILLADDHAVLRAGLKSLLNAETDMEVVGEAEDGHACLEQARHLAPDLVLLDINMPHCNGLQALDKLREQAPRTRVLVLTMHDDAGYLRQVLAAGGAGFVLKQAASDELLSAIRAVQGGGVYLHPQHSLALAEGRSSSGSGPEMGSAQGAFASLSERESEVFKLVALGHRNQEIADMLCLSVKTVETYKARLMEKLQLRTRSSLVRYALQLGILDEEIE